MTLAKALQAAAGNAAEANYIEDVFSTWLYTGAAGTTTQQTITNGIDLLGEGGLVWVKRRSGTSVGHYLVDTARGAGNFLGTETTNANTNNIYTISGFTSSGFQLGQSSSPYFSAGVWGAENYASWTFRKQEKFFDVVTWTGDGVAGRQIAHNLGSTPGCIIVKNYSGTDAGLRGWGVWHRTLAEDYHLTLNSTAVQTLNTSYPLFGKPAQQTSTYFTVGQSDATGVNAQTNGNGLLYVAYLFAHDAGGFGESGEDNVISCGSYTGNGSTPGTLVTLGWEPQWLLVKRTDVAGQEWGMFDSMRGLVVSTTGGDAQLFANTSDAETSSLYFAPTATGFYAETAISRYNASGGTYIYIAIRRGPMKVPESGTEVFAVDQGTSSGSAPYLISGFPVDFAIRTNISNATFRHHTASRLTGGGYMKTTSTAAEASDPTDFKFDYMNGWAGNSLSTAFYSWMFRRAPGFMDVCCYTGTGVARTVAHNLGVAPELMIVKARSAATAWIIYHSALGNNASLSFSTGAVNTPSTTWNTTTPTSSSFTVGTSGATNGSSVTLVAYLFASCPGVSKVGSYTGTATTQQINCGFTGGARFVLIKRTDSTGDWYVWDSARGIVTGNDPYLLLNSTAAEVTSTDYVDTYSAGFEISSTAPAAINASGGSFIFFAVS